MSQLNITLNQEEILQLLSKDHVRSLINQLSSTVFKEAERKHSKTDRIRSAFHLIQARNGTFLIESDVISQGEELAFYKESVYNKRVGNISFEIQTNQDIVFQ